MSSRAITTCGGSSNHSERPKPIWPRLIFHHTREAIEAHLTIVFAALTIARDLQARSGQSLRKIITTLKPLRQVTITISSHRLDARPSINPDTREVLNALGH